MCKLFVEADPSLWKLRTHSFRVHGASTSIRLELFFWSVLERIAARDGLSLAQLITRLQDELIEKGQERANFASFLRVCCGRYLALQLDGDIPTDERVPIRTLDAEGVLARERARHLDRPARLSANRPGGAPSAQEMPA